MPKNLNFTAISGERGYVYRCTAPLTITFETAPTLTNGWHCVVDAIGGDVVLDPNGAETINGASTVTVPQTATALVYTDGAALYARFFWGVTYEPNAGIFSDIEVADRISHQGDLDNYQLFETDSQQIFTGGTKRLQANNSGVNINVAGTTKFEIRDDDATIIGDFSESGFRLGNTGQRVDRILNEGDMASNDPNALVVQQSVVSYVPKVELADKTFAAVSEIRLR